MPTYFNKTTVCIIYLCSNKTPKSWDRFTTRSKDNISSSSIQFWETIFVITKLIVSFLLFFIVFGTAIISKICFFVITSNIFPPNKDHNTTLKTANYTLTYNGVMKTNVQWVWALIMLIGAPYLFTFCRSFWMLVFQISGRGSPKWSTILLVGVIHCFDSLIPMQ